MGRKYADFLLIGKTKTKKFNNRVRIQKILIYRSDIMIYNVQRDVINHNVQLIVVFRSLINKFKIKSRTL